MSVVWPMNELFGGGARVANAPLFQIHDYAAKRVASFECGQSICEVESRARLLEPVEQPVVCWKMASERARSAEKSGLTIVFFREVCSKEKGIYK